MQGTVSMGESYLDLMLLVQCRTSKIVPVSTVVNPFAVTLKNDQSEALNAGHSFNGRELSRFNVTCAMQNMWRDNFGDTYEP
ncbi:hypothetical protein GJ496_008598 [Pomphorhynchus laevis]|nr:hypothetical protein GJ496_008598 [Pomphorhynchus laevis]